MYRGLSQRTPLRRRWHQVELGRSASWDSQPEPHRYRGMVECGRPQQLQVASRFAHDERAANGILLRHGLTYRLRVSQQSLILTEAKFDPERIDAERMCLRQWFMDAHAIKLRDERHLTTIPEYHPSPPMGSLLRYLLPGLRAAAQVVKFGKHRYRHHPKL